MATKAEARLQVAEAIKRLTKPERTTSSATILQRLMSLPELQQAKSVMGFISMSDEVDTEPILQRLIAAGKQVYVPRTHISERQISPVRLYDTSNLRLGAYGIPEPRNDETCSTREIDFLLVPARAFDTNGNRLGRGAGFYDRFMGSPEFRATRCGVCFHCQLLHAIPHNQHDIPVQLLVTQHQTMRFPPQQCSSDSTNFGQPNCSA